MGRKLTIYNLTSTFDFGCNKDKTVEEVINTNESYIHWCLRNVDWFAITDECFEKMEFMKLLDLIQKDGKLSDELKSLNNNKIEANTSYERNYSYSKDSYSNYNDDYYYDSNDWLIDAAGCDDPEVMNDVYWNLD